MLTLLAWLLQEHQYYEDAYRVYEKGIQLFEFPHVMPIWATYIQKFIGRYRGKKLERTRDMYEQALETVTPELAKKFYLLVSLALSNVHAHVAWCAYFGVYYCL